MIDKTARMRIIKPTTCVIIMTTFKISQYLKVKSNLQFQDKQLIMNHKTEKEKKFYLKRNQRFKNFDNFLFINIFYFYFYFFIIKCPQNINTKINFSVTFFDQKIKSNLL